VNKEGVQQVLEKGNAIKWYDDPLVVLVNSNSASGSELLAAILQDYKRAVIIGSNTFGKATEQLVFPLGRKMASYNPYRTQPADENSGFVKVTTGKIFRIDGKSYQRNGVTPDILLPDIYENFTQKESDLPFALKNDSVKPSVTFSRLINFPVDTLAQLSKNRMVKSEKFSQVIQLNRSAKGLTSSKRKATLNLSQYKSESEQLKQMMSDFENIHSSVNTQFSVENTAFKLKEIQSDSLEVEMNDKFKDSIRKDIYVDEAYSVVLDLLRINTPEK